MLPSASECFRWSAVGVLSPFVGPPKSKLQSSLLFEGLCVYGTTPLASQYFSRSYQWRLELRMNRNNWDKVRGALWKHLEDLVFVWVFLYSQPLLKIIILSTIFQMWHSCRLSRQYGKDVFRGREWEWECVWWQRIACIDWEVISPM